MKKFIIIGEAKDISKEFNLIYSFHKNKDIEIVGFSTFKDYYNNLFGFKHYFINEINTVNYDYIILICDDKDFIMYKEYLSFINKDCNIINYKVFKIPFFNIKKYLNLLHNTPTIISNNCLGGILYHTLSLKLNSPFINLWLTDEDFIKFMKNPKKYLSLEVKPLGYDYDLDGKQFPTCKWGDLVILGNHYKTHEELITCWERRKKRINWDNLFVLFTSDKKNNIEEFAKLKYEHKLCISPFECEYKNTDVLDVGPANSLGWYLSALEVFRNNIPLLDLVDLLYSKKIKYISIR